MVVQNEQQQFQEHKTPIEGFGETVNAGYEQQDPSDCGLKRDEFVQAM